jgi:hypothetical protein
VPMALRELHKLQALQMLQHQRPQHHHQPRRLGKLFHGGVLPILPPLPPLLSPPIQEHRRVHNVQQQQLPHEFPTSKQQQQQQHHGLQDDEPAAKQKCTWDESALNGDVKTNDPDLDVAMSTSDVVNNVESDEDIDDDENVQDLLAEEILV